MSVSTDRRRISTRPAPELHRAAQAAWRGHIEHQLEMARLFGAILVSGEYVERGSATLVEYARRLGYHGARAIVLARLGQAIQVQPDLADRVLERSIPIENAETIARMIADPRFRDLEDWPGLAGNCDLPSLKALIAQRVEQVHQEEQRLRLVQLFLTDQAVEKLERARRVASQRSGRDLTSSQAVEVTVEEYLARHDGKEKTRRAPKGQSAGEPASDPVPRRRSRHVPKSVEHMVRERARHRCEVPGCTCTTGLELCHRRWWSRGGEHHPRNIVLLCHRHHVLFDAGLLTCIGFADDGRPIFRLPGGEVLRPKPAPGRGAREPPG